MERPPQPIPLENLSEEEILLYEAKLVIARRQISDFQLANGDNVGHRILTINQRLVSILEAIIELGGRTRNEQELERIDDYDHTMKALLHERFLLGLEPEPPVEHTEDIHANGDIF